MQFITGQQAQLQKQAAFEIGELTGNLAALQNNIQKARDTVERTVRLKYEDQINNIERLNKLIELNRDNMSEDKKAIADERKFQNDIKLNYYKKQMELDIKDQNSKNDVLAEAKKNGAPADIINAIISAKDYQGALIAADKYLTEKKYAPGSIGEYQFAVEQGYKGTFSQYQTEDANRKATIAKAGATTISTGVPTTQDLTKQETQDALSTVNQINNLLIDTNFDEAFGAQGLLMRNVPGSNAARVAAEITNIKDRAAMGERGKLKGQGSVSNFEVQMLQNAQSALNFNLSPQDARQALINFQGAIQTSSGGQTKVQVTDKK